VDNGTVCVYTVCVLTGTIETPSWEGRVEAFGKTTGSIDEVCVRACVRVFVC